MRAYCLQLLFRAVSGSAVECDDGTHLDGRGDLNSGAARQPYSIALARVPLENRIVLVTCGSSVVRRRACIR